MAWWRLAFGGRVPSPSPTPEVGAALTASVARVPGSDTRLLPDTQSWQAEAWGYWESLGEYRYSVEWKASMLSRVRLYAAELVPGQDEPVRIDDPDHIAVQAVASMAGGVAPQANLMSALSTQLDVPGEGYLVGEAVGGVEHWSVRSIDEVRVRNGSYEVAGDDSVHGQLSWRTLADDSMISRIYRPHKRWSFLADSPARAARSTMRELEMVNRHILAQYLSRLASAGVLLIPDEVSFPVREEFADAPDPFLAEWIEVAVAGIREPGTASAVVPIPMRVPGEWLDKIKHVDFTMRLDDKIIEKRDSAIKRLAIQVNIPAEIVLGLGDVNHWGQWHIEEGSLKTSIAPDAELIAQGITRGYLQPRLLRSGVPDPERYVVWYDMSELTIRPDRSDNAIAAYDRLELSGKALRRESGFDDADAPDAAELRDQALRLILRTSAPDALTALSELTGTEPVPSNAPESETASTSANVTEPGPNLDRTRTEPPEPSGLNVAAHAEESLVRAERLRRQAGAHHAVRFGPDGRWDVLHPQVCERHAYSCPYTQRALRTLPPIRPGSPGTYAFGMDVYGRLRIGDRLPHLDASAMVSTAGGTSGPRR